MGIVYTTQVLDEAEMFNTVTIKSTPFNVEGHSGVGAQTTHTGAAVGTITVEGSLDYRPPTHPKGYNAGNWGTITPTVAWTAVNNNAGTQVRFFTDVCTAWVRLKYVNASSTGAISAWFCAK